MMDWNDLRREWQSHDAAPVDLARLRPTHRMKLWQRVRRRDLLETAVAVPLVPAFGFVAVLLAMGGRGVAAAFATFLVLAIAWIPVRLWRARRSIPAPDPGGTALAFLQAERRALVHQAELLSSVARWYWGPIGVGVIGLVAGIRGLTTDTLAYAGVVAVVCAAIEVANRVAVRNSIRPAIEAVDRQILELRKESEDNDATD